MLIAEGSWSLHNTILKYEFEIKKDLFYERMS